MIVKRSTVFIFFIVTWQCHANTSWTLPSSTNSFLQKFIAQCSFLTSYSEGTVPEDLSNKLRSSLQHFIEEVDPKEKDIAELKKRNEEAQRIAWQRVATEKQSQEVPLLSFVIPCYNRAAIVGQTIESIYNQNLTIPFEVIAIDDASPDNSFEILKAYEKKYDNFFTYKNEVNKKAPATRNTGMLYARGKYICNADSDDVFGSNTIMPMLEATIENNYDTCYFQNMNQFEDSVETADICVTSNAPNNLFDLRFMLKNDIFAVSCGNRIFSKKGWLSVGGYLQEKGHDSWSFSFRMQAHGYPGYIHPASQSYFRIWKNKSSMWFQDNIHKVNDISPLHVALENLELFSEKSQRSLLNYNEPDGNFILSYAKKLELLPTETLHALFNAYSYEEDSKYLSAYFAYERAITKGANHFRVYLKQARVALAAQRFDLAALSLYKLNKKINS